MASFENKTESIRNLKPISAWVTRGECTLCPDAKRIIVYFCPSCRKGMCAWCNSRPYIWKCPSCACEEKTQTADQMWVSVVMKAGYERWMTDAWEDDLGQATYPDPVAFKFAKDVLNEYWTIQQSHPQLSFALPIVSLDVIGQGMFIDFRDEDKNVVCCYCNKKGEFTVSCRSKRLEQELVSPAKVASLLDTWIREHLFAPKAEISQDSGNKE